MSTSPPITPDSELSLHEMLQILDVARAIREEQLTVDQQFQIEETRARIRERLIASARVAGDNVTDAEVDTAIQLYFDNLHLYRDPPWGFQRILAQLYVWRVRVASGLAAIGVIGLGVWLAFFNSAMPWSPQSRSSAALHQAELAARSVLDRLKVTSQDPAVQLIIDKAAQELHAAEAAGNLPAIEQSRQRMSDLLAQLEEQYQIQIVTGPGRDSAVSRRWEKGNSDSISYYVIVEAKSKNGRVLTRQIEDAEMHQSRSVKQWGEQVPTEVYDRLKADKLSDGILNETLFGVKLRGVLDEQVLLPGADGKPLPRGKQMTQW